MFVDDVLFIAFPYVAVVLAVVVSLYRYYTDRFSYSTFSSQFLEGLLDCLPQRLSRILW